MRKLIFVMSTVFAFAWTVSAQAEMVRCVRMINGMCDTGPIGVIHPHRAPVFGGGVRAGVIIGAPAPRVYEGEEVIETVSEGHRHGPGSCKKKGSIYAQEIDTCVLQVRDQARVDREVPNAHMDNDPECDGKPSGFTYRDYDHPVYTNGMKGIPLRRCR